MWLRRARLVGLSLESNGGLCRSLLRVRHGVPDPDRGGGDMIAARLHRYHDPLTVEQIAEPEITGPHDVIVRLGGAGLCRTDLHIQEGQWAEKSGVELPYVLGHENAGWVHEIGSAVSNVEVGDTVIVHPLVTCGLCRACRAGDDVHCENNLFPGISVDGGFAELLKTSARSVVKLDPSLHPKDIAALADAGLTAYHAVKKAVVDPAPRHARGRHRRGRPRPHRHPVPEGDDAGRDHRHRPVREGARAGRRDRRRPRPSPSTASRSTRSSR